MMPKVVVCLLVVVVCVTGMGSDSDYEEFKADSESVGVTTLLASTVLDGNEVYNYVHGDLLHLRIDEGGSSENSDSLVRQLLASLKNDGNFFRQTSRQLSHREWPKEIPYSIHSSLGEDAGDVIRKALDDWSERTCLRFVDRNTLAARVVRDFFMRSQDSNYIEFRLSDRCASEIGMSASTPHVIFLSRGCLVHGIVAHEIGHALGFGHEQSRPDRDQYIRVHLNNIRQEYLYNFEKDSFPKHVPYDISSIMHYGKMFASKNFLPTMTIPGHPDLEVFMGQQAGVSFLDSKAASINYRCNELCQPVTCVNDGYQGEDCSCTCPTGLGGNLCQHIHEDYTRTSACNSRVESLSEGETYTLTNEAYASISTQCAWLFTSPPNTKIAVSVTVNNMASNPATRFCYNFLEVRLNLVGQMGLKICGSNTDSPKEYTTLNNNVFILLSKLNMANTAGTFTVQLRTVVEEECSGSDCDCPTGFAGHNCQIVGERTCNFDSAQEGPQKFCLFSPYGGGSWQLYSESNQYTGMKYVWPKSGSGYVYYDSQYDLADTGLLGSSAIYRGVRCVKFYYHTTTSSGILSVLFQSTKSSKLWEMVGYQTKGWNEIKLSIIAELNFEMIFAASPGPGDTIVAVDQFSVTPGQCEGDFQWLVVDQCQDCQIQASSNHTKLGNVSPLAQHIGADAPKLSTALINIHLHLPSPTGFGKKTTCNFNHEQPDGDFCVFEQDTNDDFDWSFGRIPTPSFGTGPYIPLEQNPNDRILYLECDGQNPGDIATLLSPWFEAGSYCFKVYLSMKGPNIGSFNMTFYNHDEHSVTLWRSGRLLWDWYQVRTSVTSGDSFQLTLSASRGDGVRGDIVIDYFSMSPGSCREPLNVVDLTAPENRFIYEALNVENVRGLRED